MNVNSIITTTHHILQHFIKVAHTKPEKYFRHRTRQKKMIPKSVNLKNFFCSHVVQRFLLTSAYVHMFHFNFMILIIFLLFHYFTLDCVRSACHLIIKREYMYM